MAQLNISDLFTPSTNAQWLTQILADAGTVGLQTTSWQSGGMARTILTIMSYLAAENDGIISLMAQGGFLDFAATGTVTYQAANGQTVTVPVSPDPSIPSQGNTNGSPTWLDVLADSVYDVQRIGAQQASNTLAIANVSGNTYGPYVTGTYHVANPATASTYSNVNSLTITPSTFVGGGINNASNTTPILVTTNTAHGLASGQTVFIQNVLGNTAANGFWTVTVTSTSQFTLTNSSGNGAYLAGGSVVVAQTATFQADVAGPSGTSGVGQINQAVTSNSGVSVYNTLAFFGSPFESNTALAARCRLRLQALSPNGPKGAYAYFALSAYQILASQTPPVLLTSPITRTLVTASSSTGVVTTTVANASGVVAGTSNNRVTAATNATPIAITTISPHGLSTGNPVEISGATGNTNANGQWTATVTGANSFTLNGSTGNGTYTGGGYVEAGDLGEVDYIIQQNAVPDCITAITQSAQAFNVAIVVNVVVPQAQVANYQQAAQTALALYFAAFPIGGVSGVIQYNEIVGVLYAAGANGSVGTYVQQIHGLTLNGATSDLTFPGSGYVAVLSPSPIINITGV
jgi:hypothetical protein